VRPAFAFTALAARVKLTDRWFGLLTGTVHDGRRGEACVCNTDVQVSLKRMGERAASEQIQRTFPHIRAGLVAGSQKARGAKAATALCFSGAEFDSST
jgi:hypothetical protein